VIVNKDKYGCVFCNRHFGRWRDLLAHAEKKHPRKKWVKVKHEGGLRMATSAGEVGRVALELENLLLRERLESI
jgi:hypothetical protein